MMLPTARAARGLPASRASAPYEITRPTGNRRRIARTVRVNAVSGPRLNLTAGAISARSSGKPKPAKGRARLNQARSERRVDAGGPEVARRLLDRGLDRPRVRDALLHQHRGKRGDVRGRHRGALEVGVREHIRPRRRGAHRTEVVGVQQILIDRLLQDAAREAVAALIAA